MSLLDEVAGLLTGRGIDVAMIGAAALAAHGVSRATADLDLLVVAASDLVLLKLYAGGPQDAWDIDQLLNVDPGIAAQVEAGLGSLPADCADLWRSILERRGRL